MKREPVGKQYTVSTRLHRILQRLVFVIPFFVIGYGIPVSYGWIPSSPLFYIEALYAIAAVTIIVVLAQVFIAKESRSRRAFFLICNHLLLSAALLFIFGVLSPVILVWLLLAVATMTYFGRRWSLVSLLTMMLTMGLDILLVQTDRLSVAIQCTLLAVLIVTLTAIFAILRTSERTEQAKVAAAEERHSRQREALLTIINGTNQAIFTLSGTGLIRIYNAALLGLLDTNDSLSGKNVDDILSLHDINGEPVSLKKLLKTSPRFERDDLILKFTDGDQIHLHVSINRIQSAFTTDRRSGDEGYVCIARDVTKEKSLDEERDEFISVVSHELRTPVAIAEGTISNLQYFLERGTDGKRLQESVAAAYEQITLLSSMINDLSTLSRADRGAGDDLEQINVKELAQTLYQNYRDTAEKKGLALNLDLGSRLGTITTSRLYLEEVLQNFITNAIKYTASGSVTLNIQRRSSGVEFAVSDTGIGISKSDLKHVFEKFYRSEDYRTRETSGTGLGLYVVTKLIHKLGSKVEVSSRLNHGSTFSFTVNDTQSKPKA